MTDIIVYRELSSLEKDLGFSAKALYSISNNPSRHYRKAYIPKGNGEKRTLYVPDDFLKSIQRKIATVLLVNEPISQYATAYHYGGSVISNAAPHVGAPILLKLDIRHFFDHITYWQVKRIVFHEDKYSESLRVLLTMLCIFNDCLPQGAATSPIISNIVMREFDDLIGTWCTGRNIQYTRYCDDMTFSGDFNPAEVKSLAAAELKKMGLFLNNRKTVVVHSGQRKAVTGLVVNEKLSVPSEIKRQLRQELYYCMNYGVESHMKKSEIDGTETSYLQSLLGRVNYVLHVENESSELKRYKAFLIDKLKKSDEIKL